MRSLVFVSRGPLCRTVTMQQRSFWAAPAGAKKVDAVQAAIADTFAKFSKDGDFANAYEELVLRGFSETDAINQVIDVAVKKGDEKAATKLVEKMKSDGILINKRTVLVLRQFASKLVPQEMKTISEQEAKELAELDAALKQ